MDGPMNKKRGFRSAALLRANVVARCATPSPPGCPASLPAIATEIQNDSPSKTFKYWVEVVQGISTIFAIITGGWWFYAQRSIKPEVKIDQVVTQRPLADSKEILIAIDVHASNVGKTKVELEQGRLEVSEINPPTPGVLWSRDLPAITLEPGESDQAVFVTLTVEPEVRTLQIHSLYRVPDTNMYWNLLSAVDIGAGTAKKQKAT
jgi:hypothetical protein